MKDKQFLMIPGPTPVPETALLAMAKHPMGHRSSEFSAVLKEVFADLKWLFQTQEDVFIFTSSGTGAMEAAIYNLVNQGDKVLSLVIGNFGERWAKIAKMRGADVEIIAADWGKAIDPAVLKARLDQDVNKEIKFDRKYDIDKFKKIYDLKNTDLPNALQSGNEIYISGEYYSVNYKYYAELFKYYWNID